MPRVLIVEDERVLAKNFRDKLVGGGHEVTVAHTGAEALSLAGQILPDVVVLDVRLPDADGIALLPQIRMECPSCNVVIVTAHGNERVAVDAIKGGAFEYLAKPVDLEELALVVSRAIDQQQINDSLAFLRNREEEHSALDKIIGDSASTRGLKDTIRRLTRTEILGLPNPPTVLISGETGTGKDLTARAIHYHGPRRKRPFIQVNCTALPATLFESELFGYARGAFTSASQSKRGLFEVAHGGTLFLDEIGQLAPEMQAKLLQALEHREIRPLGATQSKRIDVHIIAATNRDLERAVESGELRRDLYHRLQVVEIRLDPLRDRTDDIPTLVEHFLNLHCGRFGMARKRLDDSANDALMAHEWRGNVRELSHVIESAVLQVEGETITTGNLRVGSQARRMDVHLELPNGQTISVDFDRGEPKLDDIEGTILRAAYEHTGHNLSRAARALGITREALRYRLNKFAETVASNS
jgi:DNA-binding NtrC family response regulator